MLGWRRRRWWSLGLAAGLAGCAPAPLPSQICATSITYQQSFTAAVRNGLDLIFVIDDGPAMAGWQSALAVQLPAMMRAFAQTGWHSPGISLHVGVISSDMGVAAAANAGIPGCSASGDAGDLRNQPEAMCADTTLESSAAFIDTTIATTLGPPPTFISDAGTMSNYTTPDDASGSGLATVFQCIAQLGSGGCGFGQPLAALERALGADGLPPPAANAGFLRPDAYLGIVFISNQDDCSAPPGATLFSPDDLADGPLTSYRCNHAGHLCQDASGNLVAPPLEPPANATTVNGVPTLSFANCQSNEAGALTPVSKFVADIRALKSDPEQILVTGIVGPPSPYAVQWEPNPAGGPASPAVVPSCGAESADGSGAFGEPGVRLTQFIESFPNSVVTSVCDADYTPVLRAFSPGEDERGRPPCLPANLQMRTDQAGNSYPDCAVTEHLQTFDSAQVIPLQACAVAPAGSPCWSIDDTDPACPNGGGRFTVANQPLGSDSGYSFVYASVACQLALPGDAGPACAN